eukprot:CAMPEP_0171453388 /NCGR_PEP_ID=MMETSP0945-20130129/1118_1 /TAXON_ID=109269 /ORGANISM="Vaucheria litorea, Strain CCMP2940" /LENGTH=109 /DNA_ID=CAMNT_0011978249 /DNA_START=73 /DNA_END=402 /DNA_ORIENTATION=+
MGIDFSREDEPQIAGFKPYLYDDEISKPQPNRHVTTPSVHSHGGKSHSTKSRLRKKHHDADGSRSRATSWHMPRVSSSRSTKSAHSRFPSVVSDLSPNSALPADNEFME